MGEVQIGRFVLMFLLGGRAERRVSATAAGDPQHLSIGEVLASLHDEFPDVTVSKIRFLESQGLIDPERTPSGYRRFYAADIERLRWILFQQRDHFLPLRVIKERLDHYGRPRRAAAHERRPAEQESERAAARRCAPPVKPVKPARATASSALTLPLDELGEPEETDLVAPTGAGRGARAHPRGALQGGRARARQRSRSSSRTGSSSPRRGAGADAIYDDDAVEIAAGRVDVLPPRRAGPAPAHVPALRGP